MVTTDQMELMFLVIIVQTQMLTDMIITHIAVVLPTMTRITPAIDQILISGILRAGILRVITTQALTLTIVWVGVAVIDGVISIMLRIL